MIQHAITSVFDLGTLWPRLRAHGQRPTCPGRFALPHHLPPQQDHHMQTTGYIKLWRSTWTDRLINHLGNDGFVLWCTILAEAAHKDRQEPCPCCGQPIMMQRGSVTLTLSELFRLANVSRKVGRTTIEKLVKYGSLEWGHKRAIEGHTKGPTLYVKNYLKYQGNSEVYPQEGATEGPQKGHERAKSPPRHLIERRKKKEEVLSQVASLPAPPAFADDSECVKLARYLREQILAHSPAHRALADQSAFDRKTVQAWARDFDLLLRRGPSGGGAPPTAREVAELIFWVHSDGFWCRQVQSAKKLREKYTQLEQQRDTRRGPKQYEPEYREGFRNQLELQKHFDNPYDEETLRERAKMLAEIRAKKAAESAQ